jgi:hypothetical protein
VREHHIDLPEIPDLPPLVPTPQIGTFQSRPRLDAVKVQHAEGAVARFRRLGRMLVKDYWTYAEGLHELRRYAKELAKTTTTRNGGYAKHFKRLLSQHKKLLEIDPNVRAASLWMWEHRDEVSLWLKKKKAPHRLNNPLCIKRAYLKAHSPEPNSEKNPRPGPMKAAQPVAKVAQPAKAAPLLALPALSLPSRPPATIPGGGTDDKCRAMFRWMRRMYANDLDACTQFAQEEFPELVPEKKFKWDDKVTSLMPTSRTTWKLLHTAPQLMK